MALATEFPFGATEADLYWNPHKVRSVALEGLAQLFAETGALKLAVEAATRIDDGSSMHWALRAILDNLRTVEPAGRVALLRQLRDLPRIIENFTHRARTQLRIGEQFLVAGEVDEAARIFEEVYSAGASEDPCNRIRVLAYLDAIRIKHSLDRGTVPKEIRSQSRKMFLFLRCD